MFVETKAPGEVTVNPLSKEGFVQWLRSDQDQVFEWTSCHDCAIAMWYKSTGAPIRFGTTPYRMGFDILGREVADAVRGPFDPMGNQVAQLAALRPEWTYGKALKRLEAAGLA